MLDGIAMKVARCGGLWNATRIARLLQESGLLLFASGLTDPELSMAATAHFFAWAGLELPAAVNGPQYLVDRGTMDPAFRPRGDSLHVPDRAGVGDRTGRRGAKVDDDRGGGPRSFTGLKALIR